VVSKIFVRLKTEKINDSPYYHKQFRKKGTLIQQGMTGNIDRHHDEDTARQLLHAMVLMSL
jgi:hypothetical protein